MAFEQQIQQECYVTYLAMYQAEDLVIGWEKARAVTEP